MTDFYVYAYLRTKNSNNGNIGTPYYIGKGKGNRAFSNQHRVSPLSDKSNIVFLSTNLNENDALTEEIKQIAKFGRVDLGTGCLQNRTDGGEGLKNPSIETRRKIQESVKYRKPITEQGRRKISKTHKGKMVSAETRNKLAKSLAGRILSENTKQKISTSKTGSTPWNLGISHSTDTKTKISEATKGRVPWNKGIAQTEETKRKLSKAVRLYYQNLSKE